MTSPLYGDPAAVFWTAKVMKITGFPYDPICTKNANELCVRSPLYYYLLALTDKYYKVMLIALWLTFVVLYLRIRIIRDSLKWPGLLFPPIYLLFTRTYVDALTALFALVLLWALSETSRRSAVILFITSVMLVLTRETFLTLPIFIMSLVIFRVRNKSTLSMAAGWVLGVVVYMLFLASSGGKSYSDFQPHIPSFYEIYRAVYSVFTPVLPWEVLEQDVVHYMSVFGVPTEQLPYLSAIVFHILQVILHMMPLTFILPLIFSIRNDLYSNKAHLAYLIYGIFIASGLLFLKGYIDFFRHTAFLIPVLSVMISDGMLRLQNWNKYFSTFLVILAMLAFTMYYLRTLRSFFLGYSFDACAYLMKRAEISEIWYFRSAACD